MGKLLIWVVIILAVMVVMRIVSARNSAKRSAAAKAPTSAPARQPGSGPVESMVRCAHCGVHLPRSEALLIAGKTWCSNEHARLGER